MRKVQQFFYVSLFFDIFINITAFGFAINAYKCHQIKQFKLFSLVYAVAIVSRIILSYLNT